MTGNIPKQFPKIESPFERTYNQYGRFTVDNHVKDDYRWVFGRAAEVECVEKLDGINCAVQLNDGDVVDVATRRDDRGMNRVLTYGSTEHHHIVRGVQNAVRRGLLEDLGEGWFSGEVVGPKVQGNPHNVEEHIFAPFDWLRERCQYKSYGKYSTEYGAISDWFEGNLFSLFHCYLNGASPAEASVSNGVFVEGVVFVHPEFEGPLRLENIDTRETDEYKALATNLAKLRREMFSWYEE